MSVYCEKKEWNSFIYFSLSPCFLLDFLRSSISMLPTFFMVCFMTCDMFLCEGFSLSAFAIEETLPLSADGWGGGGLVWSVKSINVNIHQAFSLHLFLQCKTDSLGMQCHINLTTGWLKCPTEASKHFSPDALSLPRPLLEENNGARLKQGLAFYRRSAKAHSPKSERKRSQRKRARVVQGKEQKHPLAEDKFTYFSSRTVVYITKAGIQLNHLTKYYLVNNTMIDSL